MKSLVNPARVLCPQLSNGGRCNYQSCPYSHAKVSAVSVIPEPSASSYSTGRNGQFTGTSKGANAVPIKDGLPSFLQKFQQSGASKSSVHGVGYVASQPMVPQSMPVQPNVYNRGAMMPQPMAHYPERRIGHSGGSVTPQPSAYNGGYTPGSSMRTLQPQSIQQETAMRGPEQATYMRQPDNYMRVPEQSNYMRRTEQGNYMQHAEPTSKPPSRPHSGSDFSKVSAQPKIVEPDAQLDWRQVLKSKSEKPAECLSRLIEEKEARVAEMNELDTEIKQLTVKLRRPALQQVSEEIAKVQEVVNHQLKEILGTTRKSIESMMKNIGSTQLVHPDLLMQTSKEQQEIMQEMEQLAEKLNHSVGQTGLEFRIQARDTAEKPIEGSRVRIAYVAKDKNCVSVSEGEIVRALAKPENGFIYVEKTNRAKGWVPLSVF